MSTFLSPSWCVFVCARVYSSLCERVFVYARVFASLCVLCTVPFDAGVVALLFLFLRRSTSLPLTLFAQCGVTPGESQMRNLARHSKICRIFHPIRNLNVSVCMTERSSDSCAATQGGQQYGNMFYIREILEFLQRGHSLLDPSCRCTHKYGEDVSKRTELLCRCDV